MEYIISPIIVGIITLIIVFIFIAKWSGKHQKFIDDAESIKVGMTKEEVLSIMG